MAAATNHFKAPWLGILAILLSSSAAQSADRSAEFIDALRERGWHDTAVDYLNWVEKSPLASTEFRNALPYQRALSLAAQARQTVSRPERDRILGQALADFQSFAASQPNSPAAMDALRQTAQLLAEQAFTILAEAKLLPEQATAQREQARRSARESFSKASAAAAQVVELCTKELAKLPKAAVIQADATAKARRDELRNRQVEGRFLIALLTFESGQTFDAKAKERAKVLDDASQQFGKLAEEYRTDSVVGTSSKFYQGRCAQELGAYERALGYYEDVVRTPTGNAEFRRWAARAQRRQAECLIALDKLDEAIRQCEEWLAGSQPAERQQPEWLEVAYRLATAYQTKLKANGEGAEGRRLQAQVRTLLRDASQATNEFQQEARVALAGLGRGNGKGVEPKTFDEAFEAGQTAVDVWNSSSMAAKLAKENNPDAVEELQQQADENRAEALRLFELAMELADRSVAIDKLNSTRYYLCVMYWEEKRVHEAAVLAEFLATRYPENEYAANAAKVALAAYRQLAAEARSANGQTAAANAPRLYEAGKVTELAQLVATRWPQSPEGSSAVAVLIDTALRENRLSDAEALLEKLPPENRGAAELSLGAGLWTQYLTSTAGQRDAPTAEAIALRDKAGGLLKTGFANLRKGGEPTASGAVGALYLVHYLLATGDSAAALEALQDESVGPLTLVESQADTASRPEFVLETYKTALRAYLSASPPRRKDAVEMMEALEDFVDKQKSGPATQKLTDVYLGLGAQLQRQMKELNDTGQADKAAQVAAAFGELLKRVAARPDAESWKIRSWLAQTNLQIGQGLRGKEAEAYVQRAKAAYEAMLAAAAKDKAYAPDPTKVLAVRMRLAECLAGLGQYERAVEQYGAILREKPNVLDLQQSAATALQQWGVKERNLAALDQAIRGTLPQKDGKNLIWGWLRLATMADSARRQVAKSPETPEAKQRAAKFEDLFFEARFNVAKSRYLAGMIVPPAQRREQLEAARTNIEQMTRLYPELGGPKWKAAFTELLQLINKELAKK